MIWSRRDRSYFSCVTDPSKGAYSLFPIFQTSTRYQDAKACVALLATDLIWAFIWWMAWSESCCLSCQLVDELEKA